MAFSHVQNAASRIRVLHPEALSQHYSHVMNISRLGDSISYNISHSDIAAQFDNNAHKPFSLKIERAADWGDTPHYHFGVTRFDREEGSLANIALSDMSNFCSRLQIDLPLSNIFKSENNAPHRSRPLSQHALCCTLNFLEVLLPIYEITDLMTQNAKKAVNSLTQSSHPSLTR